MSASTRAVRAAGPQTTGDLAGTAGIMNAEQSTKFFLLAFEQDDFGPLHRVEMRVSRTGEIDRLFVASRQIRRRVEDVDDGYRAKTTLSAVPYALVGLRLPFDLTEETLKYNIEREGYEDTVVERMAARFGLDMQDLHWNGNPAAPAGPDQLFLNINNGWLNQISTSAVGQVLDGSLTNAGDLAPEHFILAFKLLPERHRSRSQSMRWMMTKGMFINYVNTLKDRATPAGDLALIGQGPAMSPLGIAIVISPYMGTNVVLGDPRNFISVMRDEVIIRSTKEGREAIHQNKRLFAIHADTDPIIEEIEAISLIETLNL